MRIYGHNEGSIRQLAARLQDVNVSLRWGGPQVAGAINGGAHLMDGLEQLQTLQHQGITVPEFIWEPAGEFTDEIPGLWLARKRNHTQGRDIIPVGRRIKGRRRWENSDFFVKYIPGVAREWRFHIFKENSIARGLKVWAGPGPEPTAHPIIRSRRLGWHMRHDIDPPKAVRKAAKDACIAVGYDLGAVDVLELTNGSACVLEVNSRPAIRDDYTLAAYERAFRAL